MNKNISRFIVIHSPKSTRAHKYKQEIRPQIVSIAKEHHSELVEIPIINVPYFLARDIIKNKLSDDDLVIIVGGDGLVNVSLDAIVFSDKNITAAVIPTGNINDFSLAINGRLKDAPNILSSRVVDFYPLELQINNKVLLHSVQYISFGATTAIVDWLNSPKVRGLRKRYRGNILLVGATGMLHMGHVSKNIARLKILALQNKKEAIQKNSFGFFMGRTSKYFRLPRNRAFHNDREKFLFHTDNFHGRTVRDLMTMIKWLVFGIPGKISRSEDLRLAERTNTVCQVGGDNISIKNVSEIACRRSKKPIKIIAPKLQ